MEFSRTPAILSSAQITVKGRVLRKTSDQDTAGLPVRMTRAARRTRQRDFQCCWCLSLNTALAGVSWSLSSRYRLSLCRASPGLYVRHESLNQFKWQVLVRYVTSYQTNDTESEGLRDEVKADRLHVTQCYSDD